ncbi:stage II sporulation protein M [Ramlibacter sp. WS9]|uniref:stage II sporulation protein M n=1 Tax=Ramlibacter sp. WS9 TaxID=1882741 RepID=UPI0011419C0A|nr:stage II sporulation protein M [Ramlibacter sp. WS9]ROZ78726.1 stage II sporulation protein M [Ramlibacter sp. WS9]
MSPLKFEADHATAWAELEALLDHAEGQTKKRAKTALDGARLAALYRAVCEQLALAQARAYPVHLTQRLESLTHRAHQLIYRRRAWGMERLRSLALVDFPEAVRAHRHYLWAAALLFIVPALVTGWAIWRDPGFILHLVSADDVQQFDSMYGDNDRALGRERGADTDWEMFGFYIMHNIGLGFQCFAAGVFAGIGSAFFLVFNGLFLGAMTGYMIAGGYSENFLSFVVTHGAFELTAIVLAGAGGLRLGHSWLSPGRLTRTESIKLAAREAVVVIYGVIGLLLIAAAVEAFWSSARWIAPQVKYGVGAVCWTFVLSYLAWQGRPRAAAPPAARNESPDAR